MSDSYDMSRGPIESFYDRGYGDDDFSYPYDDFGDYSLLDDMIDRMSMNLEVDLLWNEIDLHEEDWEDFEQQLDDHPTYLESLAPPVRTKYDWWVSNWSQHWKKSCRQKRWSLRAHRDPAAFPRGKGKRKIRTMLVKHRGGLPVFYLNFQEGTRESAKTWAYMGSVGLISET